MEPPDAALSRVETSDSKVREAFVLVVLLAWICVVYRHGLYAMPRGDQLTFLQERMRIPDDLDWVIHSWSYARSRLLTGEASYLFRPLHSLTLGLLELFFAGSTHAAAVLSLLLHTATSFALYRLVGRLAGHAVALVSALLFATQYAGMEMVVWHHISPYLWAVLFAGWGLRLAIDVLDGQRKRHLAIVLLLACLAHETIPVTLGALLVVVGLTSWRSPVHRVLLRSVALALLGWAFLDGVDFLLHRTPHVSDPADALQAGFSFWTGVLRAIDMVGVSAIAWLHPTVVDLRWDGPYVHFDRLQWDFTPIAEGVRVGIGLATTLVLTLVLGMALRRQRREDATSIVPIFLVLFLFVIVAGFTATRTAHRAYTYLWIATYYFYMTSFAFVVLASQAVALLRARFAGLSRVVTFGWGGTASIWILISYWGVQAALVQHEPLARTALETAHAVRAVLTARPDLCFGGFFDPIASFVASPPREPRILLGDTACDVRGGRGVYLAHVGGRYGLVPRPDPPDLHDVSLSLDDAWTMGPEGATVTRPATGETWSAFGEESRAVTAVDLRIRNARDGGLWFGHRSMVDYAAMAVFDGLHVEGLVRDRGPEATSVFRAHDVIRGPEFLLRVRHLGDQTLAFYDDCLIGRFPPAARLDGRVGVFHHAHGPGEPQAFADLRVSEAPLSLDSAQLLPLDVPLLEAFRARVDTNIREGRPAGGL